MIAPVEQLPVFSDRDLEKFEREKFCGTWSTEDEAAAEFDRRISESGLFKSYAEAQGYYLAARVHREPKSARIDRILFPTSKLRDAGWTMPIGVELKRSGESLGKPVSQAIDYTYAAFHVAGAYVHLEMIFLWPLQQQGGAIKSVMTQNGIGEVFDTRSDLLVFHAEYSLIRAKRDGSVEVRQHVAARKVGSR